MKLNKGIFVIGTDTGVGKTVVASAVAMCLREKKIKVGVMKPIATGCMPVGGRIYSSDAIYLFEAAENEYAYLSNPIRFEDPLAPYVAAQCEKTKIDLQKVIKAYSELRQHYDYLVVEGIGGLMVPFQESYFVSDLVKEFGLPVVIVASTKLGTINHTLLTIEMSRSRGLNVKGVIFNHFNEGALSVAEKTAPQVIKDLAKIPVLGIIPHMKDVNVEKMEYGNLLGVFREKVDLLRLVT